ncbi:B-cell receptor CD22 [Poecilia reticulata]|uniref:B-cell receptor CD22 n=1 Tax=Poecilia reticulata TaxID=8081 RepID=A0A3P9PM51_POERE|nr:PREDICTED: B-cell receptor CD22-like [Poecilia reticulata]XP_017164989.1 PREDICTED: B-cell receptor CD22-like [Poecilia reticulata]
MTMNALFVKWMLFVTLINSDFHYCQNIKFSLMSPAQTATEGSCIEIKCKPVQPVSINTEAYWFWMKDANWTTEMGFVGTNIFSSNEAERPVSPEFKNRVKYLSSPTSGKRDPSEVCNILICNLKKTDSGEYMFRYILGTFKWRTENFNLTVQENPCLITFSQPPAVMANNNVTLTCSTSISCNSDPQINTLEQLPSPKWLSSHNIMDKNETTKSTNLSFTASWTDDGREFSCQTSENKDKNLIWKVTLTVEYSPNNVVAKISHEEVKEGDYVTLTCSANGRPNVTFSWFKNGKHIQESQLNFTSIKESASGSYFCQAQNGHGTNQSNTLQITVLYPTSVQIQLEHLTRSYDINIKEGDKIKLVCDVKRSNPQPGQFSWFNDRGHVWVGQEVVFSSIKPEDSGTYECTAGNSVGSGRSNPFHLNVQYKPQSKVSTSAQDKVKVNSFLRFTCETKANPEPWFSWYHYKQSDPTNWTPLNTEKDLRVGRVQRADEGCYICNASNTVGSGKSSQPKCIQVLFPPTNISLFMVPKVKEGQFITINCTAESFPLSEFELRKFSERFFNQPANEQNSFTHTFNVTSTHAGLYTCIASNSEGSNSSNQRKLEVEYAPKDVRVEPNPGENVKENESFSLTCNAHSNPPITQFKWTRRNNDKDITVSTEKTFTVHSSKPSDSGLYICEVQNVIGSGKSQVKINIKYAPKWTTITKGEEQQHPGGRSSVTLSCSSHSYPPANYIWYNKTDNARVSGHQNFTVYSHQAGEYYCTARNEMGQIKSDSVSLFDDTFMKIMKAVGWLFFILLIIGLIFLYRHRMNKANRQRTTNRWSCYNLLLRIQGFCSLCKRPERRNARSENILTDTSRSRDDLLPQQHCRPKAQHQQPRPDVTSTSHHVNVVYSKVNVPYGKQAPSAQRPGGSQQTCTKDDTLNYASLHFPIKKKEEVESVYSQVSKPNPCKQEKLEDYENINMVSPIKIPYNFDDDSETSDEDEVNYAQVDIIPKPSGQTDSSDSSDSSTSEDETQYSDVKL